MPFSSLHDAADVARAHAALERAWHEIRPQFPEAELAAGQRERLAYIVASFAVVATDEAELADRALMRFQASSTRGR